MVHLERILVGAVVAAVAVFLALSFAWTGEVTGSLRERPLASPGARFEPREAPVGEKGNESAFPAGPQHVVQRGETLWSIADLRLGSGNRWREIYDLNRNRVSDPTLLPEGTVLALP